MKGIMQNTDLYLKINERIDHLTILIRNNSWTTESVGKYREQMSIFENKKKQLISSLVQEYQRIKNNNNANIRRVKQKVKGLVKYGNIFKNNTDGN